MSGPRIGRIVENNWKFSHQLNLHSLTTWLDIWDFFYIDMWEACVGLIFYFQNQHVLVFAVRVTTGGGHQKWLLAYTVALWGDVLLRLILWQMAKALMISAATWVLRTLFGRDVVYFFHLLYHVF